jgi:hypothetical protein
MRGERSPADEDDGEMLPADQEVFPPDDEVFPAGEEAPAETDPAGGDETFPAGAESDEGHRPGEKLDDGQPGMSEDPPRAD